MSPGGGVDRWDLMERCTQCCTPHDPFRPLLFDSPVCNTSRCRWGPRVLQSEGVKEKF